MKNKKRYMKQDNSLILLRVLEMILILACHIVQEHSNEYIKMIAQFLNVGVNSFILISGYLYVTKKISENYTQWIIKRAKRILIPLYIFLHLISDLLTYMNTVLLNQRKIYNGIRIRLALFMIHCV